MSSAARLERLRKLTLQDLASLPDRPASPNDDESADGRVSLDSNQDAPPRPSKQAAESPPAELSAAANEPPIVTSERRFVWKQGAESAFNLGSKPMLSAIAAAKLPATALRKSQLALAHERYFTPIVALSKFPYKFCNKSCMQEIASAFFDQGKFWAREWDLYYVWDIDESKPLILVRESQVDDLLGEINLALKLELKVTDQQREEGLISRFPDHPRCQPRYLGRSRAKDEYDSMVDQVPVAVPSAALDGRTLEDFKRIIELSWEAQKNKSKATKEKKKVERLAKQKGFADQFKRAQRYLGLRPTATNGPPAPGSLPTVDASAPVPYPFDRSVVFVCVDVESWEKAHNMITEVGIATLDTRDLVDVAPGTHAENWRSKIRARHFRITERVHLVNGDFVSGCPDRFDFGKSEFVHLKDAPAIVASCFKPPFCAPTDQAPLLDPDEQRNLIFLGHDTLGDIKYLQNLGFDPLTLPNLLEAQDSATLYRVWRQEQQPTKLGNILHRFNIPGFNLHNAGNDAVYTVQAYLAICVLEATLRGTPKLKDMRNEERAFKMELAREEARNQIVEDANTWDAVEADDGDGGAPVPLVIKDAMTANATPPTGTSVTRGSSSADGRGRGRGRGDWNARGASNAGYQAKTQDDFNNRSPRGNMSFRPSRDGRGRGRGGFPYDRESSNGRFQSDARFSNNSPGQERGGNRDRGRGRGRGSFNPDRGSEDNQSEAVRYYW